MNVVAPDSICFGLLAGGQSRRMGADKATLPWRGQPLWQHQLQLAGEIDASEILISGKSDGPYRTAATVVPDKITARGPLTGLAELLAAMKSDWLVAVAVDMPYLDAATLRVLLAACDKERGVVPLVDSHAEALAAVYPRALAALAQKHAGAEDRSLQSFVRAAEATGFVRLLPWMITGVFRSLNTPEEWTAATRQS